MILKLKQNLNQLRVKHLTFLKQKSLRGKVAASFYMAIYFLRNFFFKFRHTYDNHLKPLKFKEHD